MFKQYTIAKTHEYTVRITESERLSLIKQLDKQTVVTVGDTGEEFQDLLRIFKRLISIGDYQQTRLDKNLIKEQNMEQFI